ncbi:MAG TPA: hypothetical protein VJ768_07315, partial [Anaerolineales bacterium]|nr:hypothetical protein [Anaerolineales bacterium]
MSSSQLHSQLESLFEDIQAIEGLIAPWSEDKHFGLSLRLNDQGYILSSGPGLESELGYPPGSFAGRHLSEFFLETESAAQLLDHLKIGDRGVELNSILLTNVGDTLEA